jgi:hypothetical protein
VTAQVADDYADVPCPMPDCGSPLHVRWEMIRPLYARDLVYPAAIPAENFVGTWKVGCDLDHVVLTPAPVDDCCDGKQCECDVDGSEESRTFRASDIARLRALIKQLGTVA